MAVRGTTLSSGFVVLSLFSTYSISCLRGQLWDHKTGYKDLYIKPN